MPNTQLILSLACVLTAFGAHAAPTLDDVKAELPKSWTRHKVLDDTALLLLAPEEENGWQANVAIQLDRDKDRRTLEKMVNDLLLNMKKHTNRFELKSKQFVTHGSGRRVASWSSSTRRAASRCGPGS